MHLARMTEYPIEYHKCVQLLFARLEEHERLAGGEYVNWRDILVAKCQEFLKIYVLFQKFYF